MQNVNANVFNVHTVLLSGSVNSFKYSGTLGYDGFWLRIFQLTSRVSKKYLFRERKVQDTNKQIFKMRAYYGRYYLIQYSIV